MLDEFARGERHLGAHRAIKEARNMLRHIKDVRLNDYMAGANDVYDAATLQSAAVRELTGGLGATLARARRLRGALAAWRARADDLPRLAGAVWAAADKVAAVEKEGRQRMAAATDVGLRCRLVLEDVLSLTNHTFVEDANSALFRARSLLLSLPALAGELDRLTPAAEEKEGILYNLTPAYKQKYLEAVERHVEELGAKAREYKSLFAGSRARASAGVSAAHAQAGADAAAAAARAPPAGAAERAQQVSADQRARAAYVLTKAEELRRQLEQLRRGADLVSVALRGLGWQERDLQARPSARVAPTIAAANEQADRVFATTRVLYDEASELRRRVRYNLRRQLTELQRHGDNALGAAQEHISQIRGNMLRGSEAAASLAPAAAVRASEHERAVARVRPRTHELQDKIARAKHAADSITVSVTSGAGAGAGCARAYLSPGASPAVSRASIAVSFDAAVRDGPLLQITDDTKETPSYMKLEVHNRKFRLRWDLGDGEGQVTHPEDLDHIHDDADHNTYTVDVERVWSTVRLSVERAGAGGSAVSNATVGSGALHAARLWLGGAGAGGAGGGGLPACVHALYADERRVGLWNFVEQPQEASCTGCTQRWYNPARGGEPSLAWFNGEGYAELRRSGFRPSDRRHFSVAFTVRTRDEDALLFMAADVANVANDLLVGVFLYGLLKGGA